VSPCLSGDRFVDLSTAQFLRYSTTSRRKRALFVNFTAIPDHKWPANIPVHFNFTGVSTGPTFVLVVIVVKKTSLKFFFNFQIKDEPVLTFFF